MRWKRKGIHQPEGGRRQHAFSLLRTFFMLVGVAAVLYLFVTYVLIPVLAMLTPHS